MRSKIKDDVFCTVEGWYLIDKRINGKWFTTRESDGYVLGPFITKKRAIEYCNKKDEEE